MQVTLTDHHEASKLLLLEQSLALELLLAATAVKRIKEAKDTLSKIKDFRRLTRNDTRTNKSR